MNNMAPNQNDNGWFMDTGATSHMTSNTGNLTSYFNPGNLSFSKIIVGNGNQIPITNIGHTRLPNNPPLHLKNVLVTPHIIKNLISVWKFTTDNNCSVEFDPVGFSVKDLQTKNEISRCDSHNGLYPFTIAQVPVSSSVALSAVQESSLPYGIEDSVTPVLKFSTV